ncbi:MAG TPA: CbiX/SirB N-terminal domain-containing protein [Bryobacteraceae bacterium]|nr:CbiX/SirB N-terminal domain-containing protein [Bryobacteraceae bacterium]
MTSNQMERRTFLALLSAIGLSAADTDNKTGVLLLAHGGRLATWNDEVNRIAAAVDRYYPVEVALGMATKANIQSAIDRLTARQVSKIIAVPLFISSYSSVITSTEWLLGLRAEMPPDYKISRRCLTTMATTLDITAPRNRKIP